MARGKRTTPEQEAFIVTQYEAGDSIYPIAKAVGCSPQNVQVVLTRLGIEMRTRGGRSRRELTATERRMVLDQYDCGSLAARIAADLRTSLEKVYDVLRDEGVPLRGKGQQPWKPTADEYAQLFALWQSGMRVWGISRKMGHGTTTIERVLRENGIEPDKGPLKGPESPVWKGGRVQLGKYVAIWVSEDDPMASMRVYDRYVMEHRLVLARELGRPLTRHETVHHINGDTLDNRIENLQLRTGRHGKGVVHECVDCGSRNIRAVHI